MGANVATSTGLTHLNTVQATSRGPLIGVNRDAEVLAILRRVHGELAVKQEAAAGQARVKPSQYSNAINGTGNFGITWLYAQDDAFLLRWIELVMEARCLTPDNRKALRAHRIVELIRLLTDE